MTSKIYELRLTDASAETIKVPRRIFIDDIVDISLIGKRKLEYGEVFNENCLRLLENFSAPSKSDDITKPDTTNTVDSILGNPLTGQVWYNSTTKDIYVWKSDKWVKVNLTLHLSGNSGFVFDGEILPLPSKLDGSLHSFDDCVFSVSPAFMTDEITSFVCEVTSSGYLNCKYTVGEELISGTASFIILAYK